jgi:hypothetical protein
MFTVLAGKLADELGGRLRFAPVVPNPNVLPQVVQLACRYSPIARGSAGDRQPNQS